MTRLLKDLRVHEVSSVDRGAGRGVKVMIMKRDGSQTGNGETTMTDAEIAELVKKSVADGTKPLTDANVALAATVAKQERELRIFKMSDAHKAYMADCDEAAQKAFGDLADDKARDDYASKNPIKKRETPLVVGDLSSLQKSLNEQGATIIDLTKRLAASDAVAKRADFTKRAADLGADKPEDVELMMKAYSGDAEAQVKWDARLVEVNKALRAQVQEGALFGEFGSTAKGEGGGTTAYSTLMAKAEEIRKADSKLTSAQAFSKAYEDPANAELVARNKREDAARRGNAQYA